MPLFDLCIHKSISDNGNMNYFICNKFKFLIKIHYFASDDKLQQHTDTSLKILSNKSLKTCNVND